MPKGYPGSGPNSKLKKSPKVFYGRQIARDLVQDIHTRAITSYDARTIVRMLEPEDRFSIILPKALLSEVLVPYNLEPMDIAPVLEDSELERVAKMYRKSHAVIIKNAA